MIEPQKQFMEAAIEEAKKAYDAGQHAIGAVVVRNGDIIGSAGERILADENPIGHAEVIAITMACKRMKSRHIPDAVLYATHEPCPMCAGAVVWSKLQGVVYGARIQDMNEFREKHSNNKFSWRIIDIPCTEIFQRSSGEIEVVNDFMRDECVDLFHSS